MDKERFYEIWDSDFNIIDFDEFTSIRSPEPAVIVQEVVNEPPSLPPERKILELEERMEHFISSVLTRIAEQQAQQQLTQSGEKVPALYLGRKVQD
jgi:hypothetical protein